MRKVFLDSQHKLRNGWWMLIFIATVAATRFIYGPASRGLGELGLDGLWKEPLGFAFILTVTWFCTRLRGEALSSVGWGFSRQHGAEAAIGFAGSCLAMAIIGVLMVMAGSVTFTVSQDFSLATIAVPFYVFVFAVLMEELLFRGFLFQRLIAGTNFVTAQLVFAVLFAAGHWNNPGMEESTRLLGSLDVGLGAVIFGLAYLRTGRLALPVGLHLGWNWMQGAVLGFNVSGHEAHGALSPVMQDSPIWLSGGGFGPEASVFAIMVDLLLITVLWRWEGAATPDRPEQNQRIRPRPASQAYTEA